MKWEFRIFSGARVHDSIWIYDAQVRWVHKSHAFNASLLLSFIFFLDVYMQPRADDKKKKITIMMRFRAEMSDIYTLIAYR